MPKRRVKKALGSYGVGVQKRSLGIPRSAVGALRLGVVSTNGI